MIGPPYGEQRDDGPSHSGGYELRDGALETSGRRSVKDVLRAIQPKQMMPEAPVSAYVQPGLRKLASEGSRIARSVHEVTDRAVFASVNERLGKSALVDNVSSGFSNVNDRLSNMLARSNSSASMTHSSDRGIYGSGGSMRSWGNSVSAEINTFTTQKVVPFFRRSNSCPVPGEYAGSHAAERSPKEASFDYQLMTDCE
ncbi:hypothetical protein ACHAXT_006115 [Thalassiosira profunda]